MMLIAVFQNVFIVSFVIIFGTLSFPMQYTCTTKVVGK